MVESTIKVTPTPFTPPVALDRETRKWMKLKVENMKSDLNDIIYKLENEIIVPQENKRFLVIKVNALVKDVNDLQEIFQFTLK